MSKKRPHEKTSSSHRDSAAAKKPSRNELGKSGSGANNSGVNAVSGAGLDLPDKISRGNGGNGTIAAPAAITVDTNSSDHVVAITYLKERIASLEKRLNQKDKELLEKDKQVGLKGVLSSWQKRNFNPKRVGKENKKLCRTRGTMCHFMHFKIPSAAAMISFVCPCIPSLL